MTSEFGKIEQNKCQSIYTQIRILYLWVIFKGFSVFWGYVEFQTWWGNSKLGLGFRSWNCFFCGSVLWTRRKARSGFQKQKCRNRTRNWLGKIVGVQTAKQKLLNAFPLLEAVKNEWDGQVDPGLLEKEDQSVWANGAVRINGDYKATFKPELVVDQHQARSQTLMVVRACARAGL